MTDPLITLINQIGILHEEIGRLHQVCRDTYEVYAGSEGIPRPATAAEGYLHQLLMNMRDEVSKGLK